MLSQEERRQFEEDGYVVRPAALPGERVEYYVSVLDELVEKGRTVQTSDHTTWSLQLDGEGNPIPGFVSKVQGVCVIEPRIRDLASEPAILGAAQALLGSEVDFFGTKFFPKLPGGSTSTHWHQDSWYFKTDTDKIVSAAVYLEDTDADTGCLRVVPGSHRGEIAEHVFSGLGAWSSVDETEAVDIVCPAGTIVLFSARLMHGAYDNFSDRSSYRTAWHYVPSSVDLERHPRGNHPDRHTVAVATAP